MIRYSRKLFFVSPIASINYLLGNREKLHELILKNAAKKLLPRFDIVEANIILSEIKSGDFIPMSSPDAINMHGNKPTHLFGKWLYFIVRLVKPEIMIETGVAHGVSSWTILNAMHKNNKGKLYSIDLPNKEIKVYQVGRVAREPGWVVPNLLRERWDLKLGYSNILLPFLFKELGQTVDVFFHDSDHSYENMKFEFNLAYDFLKNKSLLISDDVHSHSAFNDIVVAKRMKGVVFFSKGGTAIKN